MRLFGNVADFAVVTGSGGHVAVVYAGNLNNPQVDVWLRRYAPATGWEAPRKLFNGMPYAIKRTNVSVAPDGKVLVAYVDRNRCPLVGCVERLHPRVIVID